MKLLRSNLLLGVFVIPLSTDILFTVIGQPKAYWTSGYKVINEALPIHFLFQVSPFLFIAVAFLTWLPIAYLLTKKLPKPFDFWAALALFAGHTYNSISWLRKIQIEQHLLNGGTASLIPMFIYILLVSYVAMRFLIIYFRRTNEKRA